MDRLLMEREVRGGRMGRMAADPTLILKLKHSVSLHGHFGAVNCLTWSQDGELLASGNDDCTVYIWKAQQGRTIHSFDTVRASEHSMCVSPFVRVPQLV